MVEEKFLIDTNSFIVPHRQYYAFDLMPTYWAEISKCANTGRLVLLDMVNEELNTGEDELAEWVKNQTGFVVCNHVDAQIIPKYQKVVQYVQSCGYYNRKGIDSWMQSNVADPWLIAAAASKGYTIITFETTAGVLSKKNQSGKVKIPDVAKAFGVSTQNLYYMMRNLGIKI